jgi:hypothetical protein
MMKCFAFVSVSVRRDVNQVEVPCTIRWRMFRLQVIFILLALNCRLAIYTVLLQLLVVQSLDSQEKAYWVWFLVHVCDESVAALVVDTDSFEVTPWEAPSEAGDEACVMICPFCIGGVCLGKFCSRIRRIWFWNNCVVGKAHVRYKYTWVDTLIGAFAGFMMHSAW